MGFIIGLILLFVVISAIFKVTAFSLKCVLGVVAFVISLFLITTTIAMLFPLIVFVACLVIAGTVIKKLAKA